ncbi:MAG: uroporphyrinogen-III synthase [bacterium]|nr:uroporphyrinogen-III synthase [Gammaproteobacteria bacterium]HIL95788.1 uroporphyrinogen-III synthase [Pseudomonadales bacterium]
MDRTILLTRSDNQNAVFESCLRRSLDLPDDTGVVSRTLLNPVTVKLSEASKRKILELDRYDHIVFISQNAVKYGLPGLNDYWPQWPLSLSWYAVGPATAKRLRDNGIESQQPQLASSEGLLALPLLSGQVGKVLIVRGVGGRELLRETLTKRGATVDYLEVYRREAIDYGGHFNRDLQAEVIVPVYSGEAIDRLMELVPDYSQLKLIVPSRRLQMMAIKSGFDKVWLAANQQNESMLEAVLRVVNNASD